MYRCVCVAGLLLGLAFVLSGCSGKDDAHKGPKESEKPAGDKAKEDGAGSVVDKGKVVPTPVRMSGEALTGEYKANKDAAQGKYSNKPVEVEAVVIEVYGNGYVGFKAAPGWQLQAQFDQDFLDKHPEIAKGKTIVMRGEPFLGVNDVITIQQPQLMPAKK